MREMPLLLLYVILLTELSSVELAGNCYRAVSMLESRYLMSTRPDTPATTEGCQTPNTQEYAGFVKDYLDELATRANFTYRIHISKDKKYGMKNENQTWVGMIGELIRNETDIIAAPLTYTNERDRIIDFLHPFDNVEIVLIYNKKFSSPRISSAGDLLRSNISFGTVRNQSIFNFLKNSGNSSHQQLFNRLDKSVLPSTIAEGLARVRSSNAVYLFLASNTTVRLDLRKTPCDLGSVPLGLSMTGEGFAVRSADPLKYKLNKIHEQLVSEGVLNQLKEKWWGKDVCNMSLKLISNYRIVICFLLYILFLKF